MPKTLKWVLILAAIGFGMNVLTESIKSSREADVLVAFKDSCAKQATSSGGIPPEQVAAVCSCTETEATSRFGSSGFARLLTQGMSAPEADRAALAGIMLGCMGIDAEG